jgi:sugar phosphate isomerase/epimerase
MTISRRHFLHAGSAAGAALMLGAGPLGAATRGRLPLGFQAFEIVPDLRNDWAGTLKTMVAMGYGLIDMVAMNPYTLRTGKQLRSEFKGFGLDCNVCHFNYNAWNDALGPTLDYANALGVRHVICGPKRQATSSDDWKGMAADLNRFGAAARRAGLTIAYHNHEIEFVRTPQGDIPWDLLMAHTDPAIVRFQIDVGNLAFGGGDPVTYLSRYLNRYFSFHAKDIVPGKAAVPVGAGILDWKRIFSLVHQSKIESCIAEVGAYGVRSLDGVPLEKADLTILESYRASARWLIDHKDRGATW